MEAQGETEFLTKLLCMYADAEQEKHSRTMQMIEENIRTVTRAIRRMLWPIIELPMRAGSDAEILRAIPQREHCNSRGVKPCRRSAASETVCQSRAASSKARHCWR